MDKTRVEAKTLAVVERVQKGEPLEDAHVELKYEFIDPQQAARRLAAHANAAHGEPILWIVGLDEEQGVVEATNEELSDWMSQIATCFDSLSPDLLTNINVPTGDGTVVSLVFATDRAPYVTRNPEYGSEGGGPVELEVPWREGNSTRSARRRDLIRILEPIRRLPELEVLHAHLEFETAENPSGGKFVRGDCSVRLYVIPATEERVTFPRHRCSVELSMPPSDEGQDAGLLGIRPPKKPKRQPEQTQLLSLSKSKRPEMVVDSHTVHSSSSEIILTGPGQINVRAQFAFNESLSDLPQEALLTCSFKPVHAESSVVVEVPLLRGPSDRTWSIDPERYRSRGRR